MQKQITSPSDLFDHQGNLIQSGWAKQLFLHYNRDQIRGHKLRIKEWDYYEIINPDYGIVLLIYDVGYMAKAIVKWMDFRTHESEEVSETVWFSKGALNLPASAEKGNIRFTKRNSVWECQWDHATEQREFTFNFPQFQNNSGISGHICLTRPKKMDTMVNVIPFKKNHQFVYVQKANCMIPKGEVLVAGEKYLFSEDNHSFGCLDWSRSIFPYHVEWCWSTASGIVNGVSFGLNIDYGFGQESSKNMIFHNYQGHHLNTVEYTWNKDKPSEPWIFTSEDNRVNLTLTPIQVDHEGMNILLLKTKCLKVYGFFTGEIELDDGQKIVIRPEDKLFGSAESVVNYW